MKTQKRHLKRNLIIANVVLASFSHPQLRTIAKAAGVKVGPKKVDTIRNMSDAFRKKSVKFKAVCTISLPSGTFPTLCIKKMRTHKPERLLYAPLQSTPAPNSPSSKVLPVAVLSADASISEG